MNYELMFVEHARIAITILVFSCVAALCISSFLRNGNRVRWKNLLGVFSLSVLTLWTFSELFHEYAFWRVSVYDENGDQFFSNDGRLDSHLYSRLMDVVTCP